ncbi:hypothetical protein AUC45_01890 [Erythrobacter sp. YT30]|nr:hypothetical protein AUC45_01890 [Erythrobacter sp. YT30]
MAVGAILAFGLQLFPAPDGLEPPGWMTVSLFLVMLIWWVTEAVPIPVTSLLPLVVLPVTGIAPISEAAIAYASPIVLLLMGGFIIAKSIEKWNLHARIALAIVAKAGSHPAATIGGFLAASAVLSMWISNTATAIMLTPIALSVASRMGEGLALRVAMLLAIAYGCSIGGIGTPIGTPTNLIIIGYLEEEFGRTIGFADWMAFGIPIVILLLPLAWLVLAWQIKGQGGGTGSGAAHAISEARKRLGSISLAEKRVAIGFAFVALAWLFRRPLNEIEMGGFAPLAGMTDHVIAIAGAILFFVIPSGDAEQKGALLDWQDAQQIPWGVLLLFGGGLSLAGAISGTGLSSWIGAQLAGVTALHVTLMIGIFVTFVIMATEVTSNVATASALMPVVGAVAVAGGVDPLVLAMPVAAAASCAFMLPMATGPNAVAYASGAVSIPQMARVGFALNLLAILAITLAASVLIPMLPQN